MKYYGTDLEKRLNFEFYVNVMLLQEFVKTKTSTLPETLRQNFYNIPIILTTFLPGCFIVGLENAKKIQFT